MSCSMTYFLLPNAHFDVIFELLTFWFTYWCNCWRYDILIDVTTYFPYLYGMTYFLTSWDTFHTFWRHDVHFDDMTYFLTLWDTLWYHAVFVPFNAMPFAIMYFILCHDVPVDVMTSILMCWRNFWCYDVHFDMTYFLTLWDTLWHHAVFVPFNAMPFAIMYFILCHDVPVDVMTSILMCWRNFWCYDVLLSIVKLTSRCTYWCHDLVFDDVLYIVFMSWCIFLSIKIFFQYHDVLSILCDVMT